MTTPIRSVAGAARLTNVVAMVAAAGLPVSGVWAQVASPAPQTCCPGPHGVAHGVGDDLDVGCGKARMMLERARFGVVDDPAARGFSSREAMNDTDVLTNDLDMEVVPSTRVISGTNTIRVRSLVNGLNQFTFMLRSNYTISACLVNGSFNASVASVGTYGRRATLDRAYNAGEEFTIAITYSGVAQSAGFGSITFGTQGGNPIVSTLSEAYYAGTWWPVKDGDVGLPGDQIDKFTMRLAVTAPANLRTVSNGLLESITDLPNNRRRYQWAHNYPIATYLVAFASTVYNTWTRQYTYPLPGGGTGAMPVEFNIYPGSDTAGNRAAWERTLPMLAAFRQPFGEYPFVNEKYGIYQFPFSGGMEHQTNSGQGTFSESVTAHELAHQWWGDLVTCRTWGDIWLNEGFATYGEAIWEERKPGSSGLPALHAAMASRRPSAVTDTVYVYDTTSMNRIFSGTYSYRKGGWALHMLRRVLGDQKFFDTLAAYRAQFAGSAATTDDFADVASAIAGRNLDHYFTQWVYGGGAPAYAYGFRTDTINGKPYLRLHVSQTQNSAWGVNGAFIMPMDLRVQHAAGQSFLTVNNDARTDHYVLPLPAGAGSATSVTLDPDVWILNTGRTSQAYIQGPPVIVEATPAPGASISGPTAPSTAVVFFSDDVTIPAGAIGVTRNGSPVPFTLAYNAALRRATLDFAAPLAGGAYAVTVQPTVTAFGLALDGEVADPGQPSSLPSGNGAPGGAALWTFTVEGSPCPGDWNADGVIDFNDLLEYLNDYNAQAPRADINQDGIVDFNDLLEYLNLYNTPC